MRDIRKKPTHHDKRARSPIAAHLKKQEFSVSAEDMLTIKSLDNVKTAEIESLKKKLAALQSKHIKERASDKSLIIHLLAQNKILEQALESRIVQSDNAINKERRKAHTNKLTQLPDRESTERRLAEIHGRAKLENTSYAVIFADIDKFKSVNDTYGHPAGDAVLAQFGKMLRKRNRRADFAGRWGGEEFVILLPDCTLQDAIGIAQRLRVKTESNPCHIETPEGGIPLSITASFGVAASDPAKTAIEIVESADMALYEAKHSGRNRVCFSNSGDGPKTPQTKPAQTPELKPVR